MKKMNLNSLITGDLRRNEMLVINGGDVKPYCGCFATCPCTSPDDPKMKKSYLAAADSTPTGVATNQNA